MRGRLEEVNHRDENYEGSGTRLVSWVCGRAILRHLSALLPMVWVLRLAILGRISPVRE
jgi:hypothetical protein